MKLKKVSESKTFSVNLDGEILTYTLERSLSKNGTYSYSIFRKDSETSNFYWKLDVIEVLSRVVEKILEIPITTIDNGTRLGNIVWEEL